MVLASDGTLAADVRPLVRLTVGDHRARRTARAGYAGGGGRFEYTEFRAGERWRALVREAVRTEPVNLEAVPAARRNDDRGARRPAGPAFCCTRGRARARGRLHRKGTSAFSGRIGQRVAAPECTVVDDGTPEPPRLVNIDDEGTPTQYTTLIENGVLCGYLQDKLNARLIGRHPGRATAARVLAHLTCHA